MPNKSTEGFTKTANKAKFVRNRDIKLKDSEKAKEERIKKGMCEGVCPKCREKVQWRFKFDKYKPLKAPGTCAGCHNKTVYKAYRTLCDPCATSKKICPSCCKEATTRDDSETSTDKVVGNNSEKNGQARLVDNQEYDSDDLEDNEGAKPIDDSVSSSHDGGLKGNSIFASGTWGGSNNTSKEIESLLATKYNKDRVVGSEL